MLRDAVESLLWPPMIKMLEPVDTAHDLNILSKLKKLASKPGEHCWKFGTFKPCVF